MTTRSRYACLMCIPVLCMVAVALAAGADGATDPSVDDIIEQRFQRVAGTAYGGAALDPGSPGTWYLAYASGATVCYDGKIADRKSDFTVRGADVLGAGVLTFSASPKPYSSNPDRLR